MSKQVFDRSSDAINTTGSFDSVEEEEDDDILLSSLNADPDLEWILDAASMDSSSCCDHSDHEHVVQSSSSSESLDDIGIISEVEGEEVEAILADHKSSESKVEPTTKPILSAKTLAVASPTYTTNRGLPQAPRLPRKINGDDTILNLYAATVAKAMAPPQRPRKHENEDVQGGMEPIITAPHQKLKNAVGVALTPPRTTKDAVPLVPSPSQIASDVGVPSSSISAGIEPSLANRIAPDVTSPDKKKSLDDPLLTLFASTVQKASSKAAAGSGADETAGTALILPEVASSHKGNKAPRTPSGALTPNPSSAANRGHRSDETSDITRRQPKIERKPHSSEHEQQIYLQLEIAEELDSNSNSRRFQLAIQSHISQLTMGSSLGNEDDVYEGNNAPNASIRNHRDEELGEGTEEIEMSLDKVTEQIIQLETEQAELQSQHPHPALQYDHAWMRNKLWGATAQKADSSPTQIRSPQTEPSDGPTERLPHSTRTKAASPNTDKNMGYEGFLEAWNVPTVSRISICLATWRDPVLHVCIVYLVPSVYKMTSDLPQLYFLIELVHTYDRNVQLGGAFFVMALLCRLTVRALSLRMPRLCAVVGTLVAMVGFVLKILTGSVNSFKANADTEVLPSILFVLGTILVGFNEMSIFVQFSFLAWTRESSSRKVDSDKAFLLCYRQWRVTQVSTILAFGLGGLIYDFFDFIGIAVAGLLLMIVQLVGVVLICCLCQLDPNEPCQMSLSQLLWTDSECYKNSEQIFSCSDSDMATKDRGSDKVDRSGEDSSDFKMRKEDRSSSFRSILTSQLETIVETPNTESDVEDDSGRRRSRRLSSVSRHGGESVASGSSGTPPYDNRTSTQADRARHDPEPGSSLPTPSISPKAKTAIPPAGWKDFMLLLLNMVHPLLNGLVFTTTTLYLFDKLDQAKYAIGLIYAASCLCNLLPSVIVSLGIVEDRVLSRFKLFMTLCLFGCTYMILLTAIPVLSSFVVGALGMSFGLGSYVQSLNKYQRHRMEQSEAFRALAPYRPWFRNTAQMLALLLAPIFLDVFPRLPYMVAAGCCCVSAALVCVGVERSQREPNEVLHDGAGGDARSGPLAAAAEQRSAWDLQHLHRNLEA
jgi:hypothetical protein